MRDTPQQPSRLDRIEGILTRVAQQQATNTQAIAELTDNVTRVLGRSAIFTICVIVLDNLKKTE